MVRWAYSAAVEHRTTTRWISIARCSSWAAWSASVMASHAMSVSVPSASCISWRRLDVRMAAALLAGSLCAGLGSAHYFWLQPAQYQAQPHASLPFTLQVGYGSE